MGGYLGITTTTTDQGKEPTRRTFKLYVSQLRESRQHQMCRADIVLVDHNVEVLENVCVEDFVQSRTRIGYLPCARVRVFLCLGDLFTHHGLLSFHAHFSLDQVNLFNLSALEAGQILPKFCTTQRDSFEI